MKNEKKKNILRRILDKEIKAKHIVLSIIAILCLSFTVNGIVNHYTVHRIDTISYEQIESEGFTTSEAEERFHLTTPEKTARFFINVTLGNNQTYSLGMFEMDYFVKSSLENPEYRIVDVIYKLPEEWYIPSGKDTDVPMEELLRNPLPMQKEVRRDPTFYRGIDYPRNIPFDEIELTTDFVYTYIDTNETEYDFIVRVREGNENFQIKYVDLIVPSEYTVNRG